MNAQGLQPLGVRARCLLGRDGVLLLFAQALNAESHSLPRFEKDVNFLSHVYGG